jgi:Tfp pilus assembly protein PilF
VLLQSEGRLDAAEAGYRRALELRPDYAFAHHNLGSLLLARGQVEDAIAQLEKAVAIDPDYAQAHYTLGSALGREGRLEEELAHYRSALRAKPDYPEALNNLGGVLSALGRPHEAMVPLREAVRLRPDYAIAHLNLAIALSRSNELDEAAAEYRTTLTLRPNDPRALSGLSWILAVHPRDEVREPEEAVRLAERARESLADAETLDALAAAYASANRYLDAVRVAEEALAAALGSRRSALAEEIRARLDLYRRGKSFRAPKR